MALNLSGTQYSSIENRYISIITYNHSWLRFRANYNGSNSQEIIRQAPERNNRRTLRLFGVDDLLFSVSYLSIVIYIHIYTYCGIQASERLVGREMKRTEMFDLTTEDCYNKPTVGDQANE